MRSAGRWAWMLHPRLFRPIHPAPPGHQRPSADTPCSVKPRSWAVIQTALAPPSRAGDGPVPRWCQPKARAGVPRRSTCPGLGVREAFLEKASSDSGLAGRGQETGSEFRISHPQTWVQVLTETPTPCDSGKPPSHPGNSSSWPAKWGVFQPICRVVGGINGVWAQKALGTVPGMYRVLSNCQHPFQGTLNTTRWGAPTSPSGPVPSPLPQ